MNNMDDNDDDVSPAPSATEQVAAAEPAASAVPTTANEGDNCTPFFSYAMEKAIENEDFRQLIQNTVFYPRSKESAALSAQAPEDALPRAPATEYNLEFREIYESLRQCVKLRQRYIRLSVQRPGDNPQDLDSYQGYPVPCTGPNQDPSLAPFKLTRHESCVLIHPEATQINLSELPDAHPYAFRLEDGVFQVYASKEVLQQPHHHQQTRFEVPSMKQYYKDLEFLLTVISEGPTKSFAFRRLKYLESKYQMHALLHEHAELMETKCVPHRDFYNVRKVDTHVHHSSCMNQKHLLRFIKAKLKRFPNDVVIFRDSKYLTLQQVFESLKLTAYDLSIDTLDMHAHKDSFHRFDKFNLKYNPIGESRLREIFLKTDNMIQGRYLAELTREVITDLENSKYQMAEYRISIYGRSMDEWDKVASWICNNSLFSENVRWMIQVPRLYNVYREKNHMKNFEEMIRNIFQPLFEVTADPRSHPQLHVFLQYVAGFDSVDDESKAERRIHRKYPSPSHWDSAMNPPYTYYLYYMYANMSTLNQWRQLRGFNTFTLRPHAGEAGDTEHLAAAFLTSSGINHGIVLRKVPGLHYLYYLEQIGIAMSPLSNNALFINYERNPFPSYFKTGLNISLSTDDPLQFHFTREPLIEEYSVAAQIWKLSSVDMCELARNSVLQSGWDYQTKKKWLGDRCMFPGPAGNDIHKTNVPDLRVEYRYQTLLEERNLVLHYDEPYVYSYPGWPFTIPVACPLGNSNVILQRNPSYSSSLSLVSPLSSPNPIPRKDFVKVTETRTSPLKNSLHVNDIVQSKDELGNIHTFERFHSAQDMNPGVAITAPEEQSKITPAVEKLKQIETVQADALSEEAVSEEALDRLTQSYIEPREYREKSETHQRRASLSPDDLRAPKNKGLKMSIPMYVQVQRQQLEPDEPIQPLFQNMSISEPATPEPGMTSYPVSKPPSTNLSSQPFKMIPGVMSIRRRTKSMDDPDDLTTTKEPAKASKSEGASSEDDVGSNNQSSTSKSIRRERNKLKMTPADS